MASVERRDTQSRLIQLDGIRAIAALMVIWHHFWNPWTFGLKPGDMGVRLFFVLSGFLITGVLLNCRQLLKNCSVGQILGRFYARRMLRIFPLYYAVLALVWIAALPGVRETIFWHLAYLTNLYVMIYNEWPSGAIDHFWTLGVEEQFYLVWPIVVLLAPAGRLRQIFAGCVVASLVYRITVFGLTENIRLVRQSPVGCLDALAGGAYLAALWQDRPSGETFDRRWGWAAGVLGLGAFLAVNHLSISLKWAGAMLDSAMLPVCLWVVWNGACGFRGIVGKTLSWPPLVYVGTISYGVYVLHALARYGLAFGVRVVPELKFLNQPPYKPWAMLVITLIWAAASWHLFEKPLNDLKRYFPYSGGTDGNLARLPQSDRRSPAA